MLKLIALIVVFIYVVMPLLRFLMKAFVITQVHKKMSEQEIRSKQQAAKSRKEGTIDVDYVPPKSKAKSDDVEGDYVPYEEVKD
jgi:Na+(H+)/acetate symporter ActP